MWSMQHFYAKLTNFDESEKPKPSPTAEYANLHVATRALLGAPYPWFSSIISSQNLIGAGFSILPK
jgi:hypothetical protein